MGRKPGQDPQKLAARKQRIVEAAFPVFAERTIEKVTMNDIADACDVGVATVYRHFSSKPALVLAVSTWVWSRYLTENKRRLDPEKMTAGEHFAFFLDSFLDLYRNHKDILRFNQFFNVYVQNETVEPEQMAPYQAMIGALEEEFREIWAKGKQDHTLRTDLSSEEMFSATLHLMLAAVTRYAVGLVYLRGPDPEQELLLLRDLLVERFTIQNDP